MPPIYYYWGNWDSQGEGICPSPHWLMRGKNYSRNLSLPDPHEFPMDVIRPFQKVLPQTSPEQWCFSWEPRTDNFISIHHYQLPSQNVPFSLLLIWVYFGFAWFMKSWGPISILVWKGAPRSLGALSTAHSSSYFSPPGLDMAIGQNSRKPTNRCQTPLLTRDEWLRVWIREIWAINTVPFS